jgi:AcrR family transcriptional regulator
MAVAKEKLKAKRQTRTNDPERTKADIIEVATREFSENGYSGGRVDEIAERTKTSKRMIYYYFGSKDGLYRAVLMEYYRKLREAERARDISGLDPLEAIRHLTQSTFDFHSAHADDVRLVMVENIHRARHLSQLQQICQRGVEQGVIRPDVDPLDLYMSIAALSFFNVSNRHTFSTIFGVDMTTPAFLKARRESIAEMIVRYVAAPSGKAKK